MPRIIQTNPDGSPIGNYLSQSAVGRPFQTGTLREFGQDGVAIYSGEINFDITASVTYPMMQFVLDRPAFFRCQFSALFQKLQATNTAIGFNIKIDGISVWIESTAFVGGGYNSVPPSDVELWIPANKTVEVILINPSTAATSNLNATAVFIGKYI